MKTYRVGIASLVHDHIWGELEHWKRLPSVEIVAAGDVNLDLRERVAKAIPGIQTFDSWQAMLEAVGDSLDVVQVASENNRHADIVEAAAKRGLHVVVEKPMAATLAQAERMVRATKAAGVQLLVNWPSAWSPAFQEMERRLLAGELGQIRYFKYRSAHNGPREIGCDPHFVEWLYDAEKNGAGAFMDYCCYGAAMCARFLGLPQKVTGLRAVLAKDYPLPDDNAILTLQYPHAFGVAEASWTQTVGYLFPNPIAYGAEGAIGIQNGKLLISRIGKDVETLSPPPTLAPHRSGPEYLLHCLDTHHPIEGICSSPTSLLSQQILDAGLRASDTGQTQRLG